MKAINKVHGAMLEKTTEAFSGEEVTGENKEKFEKNKEKKRKSKEKFNKNKEFCVLNKIVYFCSLI